MIIKPRIIIIIFLFNIIGVSFSFFAALAQSQAAEEANQNQPQIQQEITQATDQIQLQTQQVLTNAFLNTTISNPASINRDSESESPVQMQDKLKRKLSLDLRDMDVIDVYKFLAIKGDFNIALSKEIAGRVTLFIKEVTIEDALQIISIANNLAYKIMDNIIYVMPGAEYLAKFGKQFSDERKVKITYLKYIKPSYALEALRNLKSEIGKIIIDEETGSVVMIDTQDKIDEMQNSLNLLDRKLETKIFNLQYADAQEVANKLKEKIDVKSVGSIQSDQRSSQLIINAYPERLKEVEPMIAALDKPTKAVLIEARILQVTLNPKYDRGIDWSKLFTTLHIEKVGELALHGAYPISSTISSTSSLGTVGVLSFNKETPDELDMELKALKQVLSTKILANPKIMATNKSEARIHVGDKLAYVTTTTTGTGADMTVNEEIHYIDVGVQLKVTPTISDNGMITMSIKPEISSQTGSLRTPQGASIPLVNSTLVETNVIVQDGNTIIIGGLRREDKVDNKQGLPGLMDMPILKYLFSSLSKSYTQTEIVIFITPHIQSGVENVVEEQNNLKNIKERKDYEEQE